MYHFNAFVPDDPAKAGSLINKFVVVLQNELDFPRNRLRIVVAVSTTNLEGEGFPFNAIVEQGEFEGWRERTLIQCADLRSLLKADLKDSQKARYVGLLPEPVMQRVDFAVLNSLALGEWMG